MHVLYTDKLLVPLFLIRRHPCKSNYHVAGRFVFSSYLCSHSSDKPLSLSISGTDSLPSDHTTEVTIPVKRT